MDLHDDRRPTDNREVGRVEYRVHMEWAEYDFTRLPSARDFHAAEMNDLSPSGFSFLAENRVDGKTIVAAVGGAARASFLLVATVTNCVEGYWRGKRRFRVGCSLESKIGNPWRSQAAPQTSQATSF